MPAVSVIITSFNRLELFKRSWESIKPQLTDEDELVVVEDGGKDDWSAWLINQHPKIKYIPTGNTTYRSCSKAKNIALRQATNPLIIINDPEVWHMTRGIDQIKAILALNSKLFVVPGSLYAGRHDGDSPQPEPTIKHSMAPFIGGVMREHLMAVNGWDERFIYWGNDDNDLMYRLGMIDVQTHCADEISVFHQWHQRPPREAMGDYNEPILYEKDKPAVANQGKEWGVL